MSAKLTCSLREISTKTSDATSSPPFKIDNAFVTGLAYQRSSERCLCSWFRSFQYLRSVLQDCPQICLM